MTNSLWRYPEFEGAEIGLVDGCGRERVMAYSIERCVRCLMESEAWTFEEAWEYFEYNYLGFFMGDKSPLFIQTEDWDEDEWIA